MMTSWFWGEKADGEKVKNKKVVRTCGIEYN